MHPTWTYRDLKREPSCFATLDKAHRPDLASYSSKLNISEMKKLVKRVDSSEVYSDSNSNNSSSKYFCQYYDTTNRSRTEASHDHCT